LNTRADPIRVIEAGYQLGGTDEEWLRGVAEAVQPIVDGGFGVVAYVFDASLPPASWFKDAVTVDMEPGVFERGVQASLAFDPSQASAVHSFPVPLDYAVRTLGHAGGDPSCLPSAWKAYTDSTGIADHFALRTIEPGGRGIAFAAPHAQVRPVESRTRRLWAKVSTHLAAARRLRAALAESAESAAPEEAVLTPSGRLEHAEGDAKAHACRQALQSAVLLQEKARGRQRRDDPHAATEAWRALVTGRWSLVDRFDRDGRRYLVARPNELHVPDPRALTSRERAVAQLAALGKPNKLIGYELGIAPSTVANHLAAAARKLGARSRSELVTLVARMPAWGPSKNDSIAPT
jgi:DNA-binding CsgD family transcriptional regulator